MDLETPKSDCSSAQPTLTALERTKRPSQALYVPKQQLRGHKDKSWTDEGAKPRPRPHYTDKAKKNAKNKKNRFPAGAENNLRNEHDGESNAKVNEDELQDPERLPNGEMDPGSLEADIVRSLETSHLEEDPEQEDSWDTLFNDDGDCLDPHLLEEVRACCVITTSTLFNIYQEMTSISVATMAAVRTVSVCHLFFALLSILSFLQLAKKEGKKKESIQEPKFDYYNIDRYEEDETDLREDELSHIVEIYDFPTEFKTEDLLKLFQNYQYVIFKNSNNQSLSR